MKNLRFIFAAFSLIFFAACTQTQVSNYFTPVVDIEIPDHVTKLVAQAEWTVGSDSLAVMISKSRGALDTTFYNNPGRFDTVGNVKVELLKDGKLVATLPYFRDGFHYLRGAHSLDTADGIAYTLRISSPTYPTVETTQITPKKAKILSLQFNKDGATRSDPLDIFNGKPKNKLVDEYVLSFEDIPNTDNYYAAYAVINFVSTGQTQLLELGSLDDIAESNMLKDNTFANKTFTWRLWSQKFKGGRGGGPGNNNNTLSSGDKITVYLRSMTADQYLFRRSLDLYKQSNNFFSEPVILHSNIKNGYGIFTTQAVSTVKITVP